MSVTNNRPAIIEFGASPINMAYSPLKTLPSESKLAEIAPGEQVLWYKHTGRSRYGVMSNKPDDIIAGKTWNIKIKDGDGVIEFEYNL